MRCKPWYTFRPLFYQRRIHRAVINQYWRLDIGEPPSAVGLEIHIAVEQPFYRARRHRPELADGARIGVLRIFTQPLLDRRGNEPDVLMRRLDQQFVKRRCGRTRRETRPGTDPAEHVGDKTFGQLLAYDVGRDAGAPDEFQPRQSVIYPAAAQAIAEIVAIQSAGCGHHHPVNFAFAQFVAEQHAAIIADEFQEGTGQRRHGSIRTAPRDTDSAFG